MKAKKVLCQLAVALADHEYLLDGEGGGQLVVHFLVRNLLAPEEARPQFFPAQRASEGVQSSAKKSFADDVSGCEAVRSACANALLTMATNITSADEVGWISNGYGMDMKETNSSLCGANSWRWCARKVRGKFSPRYSAPWQPLPRARSQPTGSWTGKSLSAPIRGCASLSHWLPFHLGEVPCAGSPGRASCWAASWWGWGA